jgi:spermidine synthase
MHGYLKPGLFLLFFVSGFCGLLYQVIWVRLAFASFGIITPVLSVVISVFMLGLALGSWVGGAVIKSMASRAGVSAIFFYAGAELLIGLGAFAVPQLFSFGETILLRSGEADSLAYLLFSALLIAASVLPWCFFMGTTFPFMMAFLRENDSDTQSFSFLYLANVLGAMTGTLLTSVVLIEVFGFRRTLWIAGGLNGLIAVISLILGFQRRGVQRPMLPEQSEPNIFQEVRNVPLTARSSPRWGDGDPPQVPPWKREDHRGGDNSLAGIGREEGRSLGGQSTLGATPYSSLILFMTGFTSLALEVVWTRAFTPVMGTQVYAFALLLFVYLLATWVGSLLYRRQWHRTALSRDGLLALSAVFVFLPVVVNDPRLYSASFRNIDPRISPLNIHVLPALVSIFPFCAVLGYLTPQLIDESSGGIPRSAGRAYASNILGCILGPLVACYLLLPWFGAKLAMVVLALPFLISFLATFPSLGRTRWLEAVAATVLLFCSLFLNVSYEAPRKLTEKYVIRRDHTATVISDGTGMEKGLSINGVVITLMTPITKFMAHLPLMFHLGQPQSALVICFGMGTTYRSLLSWDVRVTAVELVPSVKEAFSYYFDDAATVLDNPKGNIVVDDGRRFLRRTSETFDVITIDPAPPAEAAGSSLLYSEQFYRLAKARLKRDGILQQWFAVGEERIQQAVVRSLVNSFTYVRAYPSVAGWGYHFLASMSPIESLAVEEISQRLPQRARCDLLEWSGGRELQDYLRPVLSGEIPLQRLLSPELRIKITDDRPFNEYFWLRRTGLWQ